MIATKETKPNADVCKTIVRNRVRHSFQSPAIFCNPHLIEATPFLLIYSVFDDKKAQQLLYI